MQITDSLTSFAAGLTPERDKAQTLSWGAVHTDREQITNAIRGSRLVAKIVNQIPQDCYREWRDWQGEGVDITAIEKLEKKLGVKAALRKAHEWARAYGEGYVYFDAQDGQDPSEPINLERVTDVRFVTPMSSWSLAKGDIDTDPLSPRYGQPMYYQVAGAKEFLTIHPSRVVRFVGAERPDSDFMCEGDSVLTGVMTTIKQYLGTVANVASLVYEAKVDVISVVGLMDAMATPQGEKAVRDRYHLAAFMKGNNGTLILDGGNGSKDSHPNETYTQKQMSFATLPDLIKSFRVAVAGEADIPMAILFGETQGGMGSTGDLELSTYYDRVKAMQVNDITPAIDMLDECLIRAALGSRPDDLYYVWGPLWQMSDKDKAGIAKTIAETTKLLVESGSFTAEMMTEPTVNAMVEAGVFSGIDAAFAEFGAPEPDDEAPALGALGDLPE